MSRSKVKVAGDKNEKVLHFFWSCPLARGPHAAFFQERFSASSMPVGKSTLAV